MCKFRFFGANYSVDLFKRIMGERWGSRRARIESWSQKFPAEAASYATHPPEIGAFIIGQAPAELIGDVDRVLYIRSLHHLNRFDPRLLDEAAMGDELGHDHRVVGDHLVDHVRGPAGRDRVVVLLRECLFGELGTPRIVGRGQPGHRHPVR